MSEVLTNAIIGTERELIDRARATMVMRSYDATTMSWAKIDGLGEWTKITLPGAVLATEIFLVNAHSAGGIGELQNVAAPPGACTDETCAPESDHRDNYEFRFSRRYEELGDRDLSAQPCAILVSSATQVFRGRVLSLRQHPPVDACPFDVFVWVPTSLKPTGNVPCNGEVGVDVGSTAMDGVLGVIQLDMACATEYDAPPPPTPPSPPPQPPTVIATLKHLRCDLLPGLSTAELQSELFERGQSTVGSRAELIETLFVLLAVESLTASELSTELEARQLPTSGTKADWAVRLVDAIFGNGGICHIEGGTGYGAGFPLPPLSPPPLPPPPGSPPPPLAPCSDGRGGWPVPIDYSISGSPRVAMEYTDASGTLHAENAVPDGASRVGPFPDGHVRIKHVLLHQGQDIDLIITPLVGSQTTNYGGEVNVR